jgi:hypothetical protein
VPLDFLGAGDFTAMLYIDGSMDEAQPNAVTVKEIAAQAGAPLSVELAPGGGFVAVIRPASAAKD